MRFAAASLVVIFLAGCSGQGAEEKAEVELATAEDSLSYAYGTDIGKKIKAQLTQMNLELNADAVAAAVKDVMTSGAVRMTDEEMKIAFLNYQAKHEAASGGGESSGAYQKAVANLEAGKAFLEANGKKDGVVSLPSGLQYRVIKEGAGARPKESDTVRVHYRGTLIDGTEFDSSHKRGQPAEFPLGGVIKGWTEGLQQMKEGATYEFFIPPSLAYGSRSTGRIPGNSTLIFEVELLKIK